MADPQQRMRRPAGPIDGEGIMLGDEYTDSISGIRGVAVALYTYLTGCDQVCLTYVNGGKLEALTVDVTRLAEHSKPPGSPSPQRGGPNPTPPPRAIGAKNA